MKLLKNRKVLILLIAFVLSLILIAVDAVIYSGLSDMVKTQGAAEKFRGTSKLAFGQVTAFYKAGVTGSEDDIYSFRAALDTEYVNASLETPKNGSLYKDAYSMTSTVDAKGLRGTANLEAVGIGGDWFFFHPLKLRSGSYLNGTDLMKDVVILDEAAAWRLFGGYELTGMTMEIGEKRFTIAGVVEREKDEASMAAYSGEPGIFMHYSALSEMLGGGEESDFSQSGWITEYEVVGADPIKGFLKNVVENNFPSAVVVNNTDRFAPGNILKLAKNSGTRSMIKEAVAFPYWENAARYVEDKLFVLISFLLLVSFFPIVCVVITAVKLISKGLKTLKEKIPEYRERALERRSERKAGR